MRKCLLPILLLSLVTPAWALDLPLKHRANKTSSAPFVPRDKWAVVVGVNRFLDPGISVMPGGVSDAQLVSQTLKDPNCGRFAGDHVATIVGSNARKSVIERFILGYWLSTKALPDDLIVVYFRTGVIPHAANGKPYLCAFDTDLSNPEDSAIDIVNLLAQLRQQTQCSHIVCVLDGTTIATDPSSNPAEEKNKPKDGLAETIASASQVTLLASSDELKYSPVFAADSPDSAPSSIFTHDFVDVLKQSSGMLPLSVVADFVEHNVHEDEQKTHSKDESPVLTTEESADIGGVVLGFSPASQAPKKGFTMGHPVSRLAMDRPDLIPADLPRGGPLIAQVPAKATSNSNKPKSQSKKAVGDDQDDEDEGSANPDFGPYLADMKQNIQSKWHPPKGMESKTVTAVFAIMRDGTIVQPQIVESSGKDEVDKSALEALHVASPLPPLPTGSPKSVQIKYKFQWNVSVGKQAK